MAEVYYTTHEVSKFCGVYPTTVINWINEGMLPAFTTPGGHRRIKKEDLIILMDKNNMPIPEELKDHDRSRVLVVDDDLKILKMIEMILGSESDLEIEAVSNGYEAGIMVHEFMPDIILLDILMPHMDGFEVCRSIRKDEKTKDIPVIAVTALKGKKDAEKMYDAGVTEIISKPFKTDELITRVRKYIPVHEAKGKK